MNKLTIGAFAMASMIAAGAAAAGFQTDTFKTNGIDVRIRNYQ